jgi:PAS domain S-box-containing protein
MKKILLIEDDPILRENTEIFLKLKKYDVITADDGPAGIERAMKELPDMIICDITMPLMSGYDVLKTLRENSLTSVIPFIFLTAKAEKEDYRKGLKLGVDDYISKPFNFNELFDAIELRLSKAENLIKTVSNQYLSLMEVSDSGFFIYHLNRFEYANRKFLELTGYEFEKLNSVTVTELISGKDQERFISLIEQCCNEKKSEAVKENISFLKSSGEEISLEVECALKTMIDESIVFIAREITSGPVSTVPVELIEQIRNLDPVELSRIKSSAGFRLNSRYEEKLSTREKEILQLIANGFTTPEIGEKLFISPRTVEFHRANLFSKTGARNLAELIKYAIQHQVVEF